jgi:hypothetical protein
MENRTDILNELQALSPTIAALEKLNVFTVPEGYFEYLSTDILLGINTENDLLSGVSNDDQVPAGYFDSLAGSILDKIKAQEIEEAAAGIDTLSEKLSGIGNKNVFEAPEGYFESLADSILVKIKANEVEDSVTEIRALSPMLYTVQNERVFEVPAGYFENLSADVLEKINPQAKVVTMQRRSNNFFKYAVAAAFTGVMALSVFKFTATDKKVALPDYVTAGLKVQDVDQELAKISDDDIVKYLEASGTDVKTAMVANSIDENELPSQEDYLLDEKALDKYLNSINVNDLKN